MGRSCGRASSLRGARLHDRSRQNLRRANRRDQMAVGHARFPDIGRSNRIEHHVLAELDPPLNLEGLPHTPTRSALSRKRAELPSPTPRALGARTSPRSAAPIQNRTSAFTWSRRRRDPGPPNAGRRSLLLHAYLGHASVPAASNQRESCDLGGSRSCIQDEQPPRGRGLRRYFSGKGVVSSRRIDVLATLATRTRPRPPLDFTKPLARNVAGGRARLAAAASQVTATGAADP